MNPAVGEPAPEFNIKDQNGASVSLNEFRNKKHVVLSFHVFDFTGGWTNQVSSFNQSNSKFEEKDTQVLGVSCDSQHSHRAWSTSLGNVRYSMLADFHPHGAMVKSYGLFNESNGAPRRAVIIIDKEGIIRFRQEYPAGTLPNVDEILTELDGL